MIEAGGNPSHLPAAGARHAGSAVTRDHLHAGKDLAHGRRSLRCSCADAQWRRHPPPHAGCASRRVCRSHLAWSCCRGGSRQEQRPWQGQGSRSKGKHQHQRGKDHRAEPKRIQARAEPCWRDGACIPSTGANVSYCDLEGSTAFTGLDCTRCNLCRSNLRGVDASGATFTRANLSYACLVDANLSGATVAGNTNLSYAVLCRTTMPNGSLNNSGCHLGTDCCPTCDIAHPCTVPGQRCCHGRCVSAQCCAAGDCAEQTCKSKDCQNFQCVYANQSNGVAGSQCANPRQCCNGTCCGNGEQCCNGTCCPSGQQCCGGTCIAKERCCDNGTPDACPTDRQCCGGTCISNGRCCTDGVRDACPETSRCCLGSGVCIAEDYCCTDGQPGCPGTDQCCNRVCSACCYTDANGDSQPGCPSGLTCCFNVRECRPCCFDGTGSCTTINQCCGSDASICREGICCQLNSSVSVCNQNHECCSGFCDDGHCADPD